MRLNAYFHVIVYLERVFVVVKAKDAFINEIELFKYIQKVQVSTTLCCIFNYKLELFFEVIALLDKKENTLTTHNKHTHTMTTKIIINNNNIMFLN